MRTNITLDDDIHQLASIYAAAKGITLGAAISELIRKAESHPKATPEIRRSESGLAMFPPTGKVLTPEMVKEAESEFD
jgi:hypothetical protein